MEMRNTSGSMETMQTESGTSWRQVRTITYNPVIWGYLTLLLLHDLKYIALFFYHGFEDKEIVCGAAVAFEAKLPNIIYFQHIVSCSHSGIQYRFKNLSSTKLSAAGDRRMPEPGIEPGTFRTSL